MYLKTGSLNLSKSFIVNNEQGISVEKEGELILTDTNLFSNSINIITDAPLTLKGNYLSSSNPNEFNIKGEIKITSFLDAPYPGGTEHIFDKEAQIEIAEKEYNIGLQAFKERNYGKAYEHLKASLKGKESRQTRIYLAYVLSSLSENEKLEDMLKKSIELYPYESRFVAILIKKLLNEQKYDEAHQLLDKAIKLNPGDEKLKNLRDYISNE